MTRPACLIVVDGWGLAQASPANPCAAARLPNLDRLFGSVPWSALQASGEDVGLRSGQMGNSNVGHLNLGAGRVVWQDLLRISREAAAGGFTQNQVLLEAVRRARGSALHLLGLVSDGGVHSHLEHLFALLELAKGQGAPKVWVHAFLDGRDVGPVSAGALLERLEARCLQLGNARIATVMGRYYAMDRDKRWDRTEQAYRTLLLAEGPSFPSAADVLADAYRRGETDEFVRPAVVGTYPGVSATDALFHFNFRADRARQLCRAIAAEEFSGFNRPGLRPYLATMTQYDASFPLPAAFPPLGAIPMTLGEAVSRAGLRQLRVAETEKYAHVTYFFNGGREQPYPGEDRVLIPSPRVSTYDLQPEMSAPAVTAALAGAIRSGEYGFILANYANPDMVGHTGDFAAAVRAMEAVDRCLGTITLELGRSGQAALILSDHGNVEEMKDAQGKPLTAHSLNPVPCLLLNGGGRRLRDGILADVAPTVLELMGLPRPPGMTGQSLLVEEARS
ncbi:MAG: 2,3-bisphosphoglycerate-independent phosphoglycerate mutase [Bacillota bacterium]